MAPQATSQTNVASEEVENLQAQAQIINHCFAFADSLALKSAVELHIPDIIHSHGHPVTITEIASKFDSRSPNIPVLARVMRALARKNIFTISYNHENKEPLYGLTPASKLLIRDSTQSFAPMFLALSHPMAMAPWHGISSSIKEGGPLPFEATHGVTFWEMSSRVPEFNELFNTGMALVTRVMMNAILEGYKDGFSELEGTLVDVAGGTGNAVAEIVMAHPHIEGINFDLPHVVVTASPLPGVTHVGGDMFKEIPKANTIFVKSVLHNWGDEDCTKILKNMKNAMLDKKGKVIIVETILQSNGKQCVEDAKMTLDLVMTMIFGGGKERTESEWKKLLHHAGFARYNIIRISSLVSIIEAFPR
ncbi:hypothetical protein vseg_018306 [Gypsophila vaccaria]